MFLQKRLGGEEFNIRCEGSGEPLLFVHGFPLDHTMWEQQIVAFSETHHVIAPDLRGFGASTTQLELVRMEEFADDLAAILDALSITSPFHFCGLSMGGYIAFQFFLKHRERMQSLILCDTKAAADTPAAQQTRRETAAKVLGEGPEFLSVLMAENLFSQETCRNNSHLVQQTQEVIRRTSSLSIAAALLGMAERPHMTAMLPRIDLPTLVIAGAEDAITPSAEMQQLAESIPGALFVEVPQAGHMAPLEQPQFFNLALADFLANLA